MQEKYKRLVLRDFLPYRLFTLASHISYALAKRYEKKFCISQSEWRTIAVLGEKEPLSASQICTNTAMDKVTVSRAVNRLLERKILERAFSSTDRRRSEIRRSKTGRNIYDEISPLALKYEDKILGQLSESEISNLIKLLDKLEKIEID